MLLGGHGHCTCSLTVKSWQMSSVADRHEGDLNDSHLLCVCSLLPINIGGICDLLLTNRLVKVMRCYFHDYIKIYKALYCQ